MKWAEKWGMLLLVAGAAFSLWVFSININGPIAGEHAFRQTQTAFSVHRAIETGIKLDYETPLFGPDWQVPFEFPTFQALAALVGKTASIDSSLASRIVSILFFYVFCLASHFAMKELSLATTHRRLALSLLLFSPLYLNWSRATMIESTAIAFGMIFYALALRAIRTRSTATLALSGVSFIILTLTKITTVPVFLGMIAPTLFQSFKRGDKRSPAVLVGFMGLALAAQVAWNHRCDAIKMQNELTHPLVSSALTRWTFGAPMARFDLIDWKNHLRRVSWLTLGQPLILLICMALSAALPKARRAQFWFCSIVACVPVFIFYNLQRAHSYYSMANAFLFLFACSVIVHEFLERLERRDLSKPAFFACALIAMSLIPFYEVRGFFRTYYDGVMISEELESKLGPIVRAKTEPSETLIYLGSDWDPTVPYEIRRPAVVWAESLKTPWETYFRFLEKNRARMNVSGIVMCGDYRVYRSKIEELLVLFPGLNPESVRGSQCQLFFKRST